MSNTSESLATDEELMKEPNLHSIYVHFTLVFVQLMYTVLFSGGKFIEKFVFIEYVSSVFNSECVKLFVVLLFRNTEGVKFEDVQINCCPSMLPIV